MTWIDWIGWAMIGVMMLAFVVVAVCVMFVPHGPHQGECEHGTDETYCPECNGFGE